MALQSKINALSRTRLSSPAVSPKSPARKLRIAPRSPVAYCPAYALLPSTSNPQTSSFASSSSTLADLSFFECSEQACGLRDESQIPVSLDSQQSLSAASFDAGIQIGHGKYNRPPLGNQADGEPQMKDQS